MLSHGNSLLTLMPVGHAVKLTLSSQSELGGRVGMTQGRTTVTSGREKSQKDDRSEA